jgi:beta-lactamase superfamily II metal-dependent hydrolase
LQHVLLTHGDLQHIGGFDRIKSSFALKKTFTSPVSFRSGAYRKILNDLKAQPQQWQTVAAGDSLAGWTVLHPLASDDFSQADDKAVVLRRDIFGKSVLLLSDLGRLGQTAALARTNSLRANFVVSGLPTQSEALSKDMLSAIQPELIYITDTDFPATSRAPRKLKDRLAQRNGRALFGREEGAMTLTFGEDGCLVRTARSGDIAY